MGKKVEFQGNDLFVNGVKKEDWCVIRVDGVPHLFVDGVSVGTLKEHGLREEQYAISSVRTVDETTGVVTVKAIRPNGDVVITRLGADGTLIDSKVL